MFVITIRSLADFIQRHKTSFQR